MWRLLNVALRYVVNHLILSFIASVLSQSSQSPHISFLFNTKWKLHSSSLPRCLILWGFLCPLYSVTVFLSSPERSHLSTRVPGHAFLAWRILWRMVGTFIAAGYSISSQLGISRQRNPDSTEKAGSTARPSRTKSHLPGTLLQPAKRAAVSGQPSSLRPYHGPLSGSIFRSEMAFWFKSSVLLPRMDIYNPS